MDEFLRVGIISSTHGIKGEVKVFPTTDDMKRFQDLKEVYLDLKTEKKVLEIQGVKYFKQFVILKFKGIDDINLIERYKGVDLLINRKDALPLAPNENYICDLIGCRVITDQEEELGILRDILVTGANDVYVVETVTKDEILLPAIKDCVLDVNVDEKQIIIHLLPGLLDIYKK